MNKSDQPTIFTLHSGVPSHFLFPISRFWTHMEMTVAAPAFNTQSEAK